jgi:hypothetical protein
VKTVKRKVLVIVVALMAVAMLATQLSAVLATKPTEIVDCSFATNVLAITVTPIKLPIGGSQITIVEMTGTDCQIWTGDISGVADYSACWVFHGELGAPDTFITHNGLYIFDEATVTVDGVTATGGLVIKAAGNKAAVAGAWRVISSDLEDESGEPVSLHGQGEFLEAGIFTYDVVGQLHLDP